MTSFVVEPSATCSTTASPPPLRYARTVYLPGDSFVTVNVPSTFDSTGLSSHVQRVWLTADSLEPAASDSRAVTMNASDTTAPALSTTLPLITPDCDSTTSLTFATFARVTVARSPCCASSSEPGLRRLLDQSPACAVTR